MDLSHWLSAGRVTCIVDIYNLLVLGRVAVLIFSNKG